MHDLKYCVRHNGKVYCWDVANKRIVTVVISDIDFSECPQKVMQMIMEHLDNGKEGG
jgi:bifunctional pyridoxal-dependent enzyme with beta-cystathionase and maltose regulon repressor activities